MMSELIIPLLKQPAVNKLDKWPSVIKCFAGIYSSFPSHLYLITQVFEDGLRLPRDPCGVCLVGEGEAGVGVLEALHLEVAVVHVERERVKLHRAEEGHLSNNE